MAGCTADEGDLLAGVSIDDPGDKLLMIFCGVSTGVLWPESPSMLGFSLNCRKIIQNKNSIYKYTCIIMITLFTLYTPS